METKSLCEEKRDFNQNLIESPGSFEQLCDMINQLEEDSSVEIAKCKQLDMCIKYDANPEPASRNCLDQVSDRKVFLKLPISVL